MRGELTTKASGQLIANELQEQFAGRAREWATQIGKQEVGARPE
jgi:hypothetical protein